MCITLTKHAGFNEVQEKDVEEVLEFCDSGMSTDRQDLPKEYRDLKTGSDNEEASIDKEYL